MTKLLVPVLVLALAAVALPGGVVAHVGTRLGESNAKDEPMSLHRTQCGEVYAVDGFSRTVPANHSWGHPEIGSAPWEVTFGGSDLDLWSVENGMAKARTTPMASSGQRVPAARDIEMQARFSLGTLTRGSSVSTGFFARFRRVGGPVGDHVRMRVRTKTGRFLVSVSRVVGGVTTSTEEKDAGLASPNVWFWRCFKVVDDTIQGKLWRNRKVEPAWLAKMRHPAIATMVQTDAGIRNTYTPGPMFPTIHYDDFRVSAPACPVGPNDIR
ncbi:hypothetical protein BH20ACT13_BH20ACT13_24570 [soil metagenome]